MDPDSASRTSQPETPNHDLFVETWQVYRKMVDNDYLFHSGAYLCLSRAIARHFPTPFAFLDLACGDASMSVEALKGALLTHYTGVDISEQALELARTNLKSLRCPVSLRRCNFYEALSDWSEPADLAWIGLSLHHFLTDEKLVVMRNLREILRSKGRLLIYEDTLEDGESRQDWLARWDAQRPLWTAYTEAEWNAVTDHVHSSDFPEPDASWRGLGQAAGFRHIDMLYRSPSRLFRVYAFH